MGKPVTIYFVWNGPKKSGAQGRTAANKADQELTEKWDTDTSHNTPSFSAESIPPKTLTAERLRELLRYDPKLDRFYWRKGPRRGQRAGRSSGKNKICIARKIYSARRLAWLYTTGEWPKMEVVGKGELREATRAEIIVKRSPPHTNTSGVKGVYWSRRERKWRAQIGVDYRCIPLGGFDRFAEAVAARQKGEAKYFGPASAKEHLKNTAATTT